MLADICPTCFVATTDVTRARNFYVDTLGLEPLDESPAALVVRSGQTTIRITPVESHDPLPGTILGWSVPDIMATVGQLAERGVEPLRYDGFDQDANGIWTIPGADVMVAWFADPDGNTLSLTQF